MNIRSKIFRKKLESLKGREGVFREYSFLALVHVIDVTTTNEGLSITFKLINAKSKGEPITISSIWSNVSKLANGFAIGYVGSQMIIDQDAVELFKEQSKKMKTKKEKMDLFRKMLDGVSNTPNDYGSLNRFKITTIPSMGNSSEADKSIWSFEWSTQGWFASRTDFYDHIEGKSRKKRSIQVSQKSINAFIKVVQSIKIPLAISFSTGCDGEVTEFEYGDSENGLKLRWWSDPLNELELLNDAVTILLEELRDD